MAEGNGAKEGSALLSKVQKWADGKATLRDVRGYSDGELHAIARTAYFFYYQGRLEEARTLFQGLYAIDPTDSYFAKALAVVELACGNAAGALQAYDVAVKIDPKDAAAYVGRAEVKLAQGQKTSAAEDLRKAEKVADEKSQIKPKVSAMLRFLRGK